MMLSQLRWHPINKPYWRANITEYSRLNHKAWEYFSRGEADWADACHQFADLLMIRDIEPWLSHKEHHHVHQPPHRPR